MALTLEINAEDKASPKVDKLNKKVKNLGQQTARSSKSMIDGFMKAKAAVLGVTAAIGGTVVAFTSMILKVTTFQDQIAKTSRALGVTTEFLSSMSFAAERSGTTIESVTMGLRLLMRRATDASYGLETAERSFKQLGITVTNESGTLKAGEQLFLEVAEKLGQLEDSTKRAALAQELFGRSGTALLPLMEKGAGGIKELQKQAKELGIVFDQETGLAAENLQDNIANLNFALKGLQFMLVKEIVPGLTDVITFTTGLIKQMDKLGESIPFRAFMAFSLGMARMTELYIAYKKATKDTTEETENLNKSKREEISLEEYLIKLRERMAEEAKERADILASERAKKQAAEEAKRKAEALAIMKQMGMQGALIEEVEKRRAEANKDTTNQIRGTLTVMPKLVETITSAGTKTKIWARESVFLKQNMENILYQVASLIDMVKRKKFRFSDLLGVAGGIVSLFNPGAGGILMGTSAMARAGGFQHGGSFIAQGPESGYPVTMRLHGQERVNIVPQNKTTNNYSQPININIVTQSVDEIFLREQFIPMWRKLKDEDRIYV